MANDEEQSYQAASSLRARARDILVGLTDLAPDSYIQYVDDNVAAKMPAGTVIKRIFPHGSSYWSRTAAIETMQADGSSLDFFLKLNRTEAGKLNVHGEYACISSISEVVPDLVPTPIGAGTYASDPSIYFYLQSFVDLGDDVPEVEDLPTRMAEMHLKGTSPNGKFGFSVPTNMGPCTQMNMWTSSWEKSFSTILSTIFEFEQGIHGADENMQKMYEKILERVIPRLLRPLETGGREIKPRIVHGALWDGNASTDLATDKTIIYDASGMYAHNEYELGAWNHPRHKIYRAYIREYQKHFAVSAPEEDVDDRLILYRLRFNMTSSSCYFNNSRFRDLVIEDMGYLTSKYPLGYEGSEPRKAD